MAIPFSFHIFSLVLCLTMFGPTLSVAVDISTCEKLQDMSDDLDGDYVLANDIDCINTSTGLSLWDASGFEPIGIFTGTFDGQNHTIANLFINRPSTLWAGLFWYTSGAVIMDVGLTGVNITGGCPGVDTNCGTGGLVGFFDTSYVNNSYVTGSLSGGCNLGGLVGWSTANSVVNNSYSAGSISGAGDIGGLAGRSQSLISSSYATGNVTCTGNFCGGLVGQGDGGASIHNSYATGDVSGAQYVGGLVGLFTHGNSINNSYAAGDVTCADLCGGLVGENAWRSIVNYSFSTGSISGGSYVGGLVGHNFIASIDNSYWYNSTNGDATTCANDEAGTMNCTAETDPTYFYDYANQPIVKDTNWQFLPWDGFCNGSGYPSLAWQDLSNVTDCPGYRAFAAVCGDGIINGAEECDNATDNGVSCSPDYDETCISCSETCTNVTETGPSCGDGDCNNGETCHTCSEDCGRCKEETGGGAIHWAAYTGPTGGQQGSNQPNQTSNQSSNQTGGSLGSPPGTTTNLPEGGQTNGSNVVLGQQENQTTQESNQQPAPLIPANPQGGSNNWLYVVIGIVILIAIFLFWQNTRKPRKK